MKSNNVNTRLDARKWVGIILIGLIGQIAWAIENNYINLWVYSQSHTSDHINWMTVASAVVATVTTFFVGALSDKLGKRKIFIAGGYSIWGIFVFLFGVMSLTNMEAIAGAGNMTTAILLVGIANVIVDCLMTFFGSSGNDAAFNAYVTDITNQKNRPFVESVLSIMPLISLAMILGLGGILGIPNAELSPAEAATPWLIFFLICGALTTVVGIVSFFLLPNDEIEPNREDNYFKHMIIGFHPKSVKANPIFYIALIAFMCFNIGVDAFMPYIMVYFQNIPSFGTDNFLLGMGIIMGVASLLVIVVGAFLEKIGKEKVLIPSVLVMATGAMWLYFVGDQFALLVIGGVLLMTGYLVGTASLGAAIRDLTPQGDVGAYQSVRMVFAVMLPMVIGSNISNATFVAEPTLNEYGQPTKAPDHNMFIVTAIAAICTIVPIIILIIKTKKSVQVLPENAPIVNDDETNN